MAWLAWVTSPNGAALHCVRCVAWCAAPGLCSSPAAPSHRLPPHPRRAADEDGRLRVTPDFLRRYAGGVREEQLIHRRYAFEIILQVRGGWGGWAGGVVCVAGWPNGAGPAGQEKTGVQSWRSGTRPQPPSLWSASPRRKPSSRRCPAWLTWTSPLASHVTVCGDTHGQFYDLLRIFDLNGLPSDTNPYLFNGALQAGLLQPRRRGGGALLGLLQPVPLSPLSLSSLSHTHSPTHHHHPQATLWTAAAGAWK